MVARPAIFLDRDGVINENRVDHVKSWDEFRFVPGALAALRRLSTLELPIVVVTNQAIVNRAIISNAELDDIHLRMTQRIRAAGARLDGIFYCPHSVAEGCGCRKPEPGLLIEAAAALNLDLTRSVFVGDATTDLIAGQRAACPTILVRTGRGRDTERELSAGAAWPFHVAGDLLSAVPVIEQYLGRKPRALHHHVRTFEEATPVPMPAALVADTSD